MPTRSTFSFRFRVTLIDGEPVDVTAGPGELVKMERKFGVGIGNVADPASMRFEWLCFLAWAAQTRAQEPNDRKGFDEWLDVLDDLEIEADDEAGADPTAQATTPAATPAASLV